MPKTVRPEDAAPPRAAGIALWLIGAAACALFVAAATRFYFGPAFAALFNSDAAVPVLLANEVLRTGNPLPATWYFGNNEIWTLSPHVFAMPFVAALGISELALKLGNLLCIGVAAFFLALPLHRITRSWPYSLLVAAGVFAAFSGFQELVVYMQTAYGWFCGQFAILIYLAFRMQDEAGPEPWHLFRRVPWTTALYLLFLINLSVDSPSRAAAYWVFPAVAVAALFPYAKSRSWGFIAWTIAGLLAGIVLHEVISRHIRIQAGVLASVAPKSIGEWGTSFARLVQSLPVMIGYAPRWYAWPFDGLGMFRISFFAVAALAVLFVPAGEEPGSAACRFLARVSCAMLLGIFVLLVVSPLTVDAGAGRYLVPPALLCLAALMAVLWIRLRTRAFAITAIAAIFMFAFCGGAVMLVPGSPLAFERVCDAPGNVCRLSNLLSKAGLRRGYATYWKGNVTTVASGGTTQICGITLTPHLAPFRWLVSKDCFDHPSEDRYFIAFDRAEIARAGRDYLVGEAGRPDQVLTDPEHEVWIYTTAAANLDWLRR